MKNLSFIATVCLALNFIAQISFAQSIWYKDLNAARREAERLNRPLLCHFGATWCAPCQKMERTVFNQQAVLDQLRASAVCVKIDVDENKELAQRFGVSNFPTDVFLEPNGQRLMESTGYQSAEEYRAFVDRASRRYSSLLASRQQKTAPPIVTTPDPANDPSLITKNVSTQLMLEGYCPVSLSKTRDWKLGNGQIRAEYKGQIYQFVGEAERVEFLQSPDRFVPQFLGCDPVLIFTADRAVPGSIEWAAYFDGQLFLFANEDNRRNFKASPEKYIRTRVVLDLSQIEVLLR
ncbi:thioredoxin family protein [Planctomicrobium sp. SH668]|uniref:thioredoxin family protein n=1 Tax=Planctomicrobium sp. SH668 TaxID=3448126 RepID=UPI003F5B9487